MHSSTQTTTGGFAVVETQQMHGPVTPPAPETLGPRVLELSGILQTTLDLEQQITLFARSIRDDVPIDGLEYDNPAARVLIRHGEQTTHKAAYDLQLDDRSLGVISFFRDLPFSEDELHTLENLLCALVYPLRNALSYLEALRLASHDPLTGIQNRLALEHALQREVDLARRQRATLSMLVIDADHFKRFNDEYGHAFGDDVLRALANAMSATVRRSDLLFRYGGEEFVVLASHAGRDGARLLAERIREAVAGIRTIDGQPVDLSVSIGVAELTEDESPESLFERADQAVYQAKEAGRDRVELA